MPRRPSWGCSRPPDNCTASPRIRSWRVVWEQSQPAGEQPPVLASSCMSGKRGKHRPFVPSLRQAVPRACRPRGWGSRRCAEASFNDGGGGESPDPVAACGQVPTALAYINPCANVSRPGKRGPFIKAAKFGCSPSRGETAADNSRGLAEWICVSERPSAPEWGC